MKKISRTEYDTPVNHIARYTPIWEIQIWCLFISLPTSYLLSEVLSVSNELRLGAWTMRCSECQASLKWCPIFGYLDAIFCACDQLATPGTWCVLLNNDFRTCDLLPKCMWLQKKHVHILDPFTLQPTQWNILFAKSYAVLLIFSNWALCMQSTFKTLTTNVHIFIYRLVTWKWYYTIYETGHQKQFHIIAV